MRPVMIELPMSWYLKPAVPLDVTRWAAKRAREDAEQRLAEAYRLLLEAWLA